MFGGNGNYLNIQNQTVKLIHLDKPDKAICPIIKLIINLMRLTLCGVCKILI
jgi:hypothetical protein